MYSTYKILAYAYGDDPVILRLFFTVKTNEAGLNCLCITDL